MSEAEVSRRLEGLTIQQLEEVREYEKHNKNRETLIEQIDRKKRPRRAPNASPLEGDAEGRDAGLGHLLVPILSPLAFECFKDGLT